MISAAALSYPTVPYFCSPLLQWPFASRLTRDGPFFFLVQSVMLGVVLFSVNGVGLCGCSCRCRQATALFHFWSVRGSVLQCALVCCNVLQCVAGFYSALPCVAVCCKVWWLFAWKSVRKGPVFWHFSLGFRVYGLELRVYWV